MRGEHGERRGEVREAPRLQRVRGGMQFGGNRGEGRGNFEGGGGGRGFGGGGGMGGPGGGFGGGRP